MSEAVIGITPGAGKNIRNQELPIRQPDGTVLTVEQQNVTRTADDGTILDTMSWIETSREKYMRLIAEDIQVNLQTLVGLMGGPFDGPSDPPTAPLGE